MTCGKTEIKELLPDYIGQKLERTAAKAVESHLAACEECRAERELLSLLAQEQVPDPGGAFWKTMPQRIHREVELKKSADRSLASRLSAAFAAPRLAWTTAGLGVLAVALWFSLHQPAGIKTLPTAGSDITAIEETMEPANLADFNSLELDAVTQWAQNQIVPMREAIMQDGPDTDQDISEDMNDLSNQELDRIYEMLREKERELKKGLPIKQEKNVG